MKFTRTIKYTDMEDFQITMAESITGMTVEEAKDSLRYFNDSPCIDEHLAFFGDYDEGEIRPYWENLMTREVVKGRN